MENFSKETQSEYPYKISTLRQLGEASAADYQAHRESVDVLKQIEEEFDFDKKWTTEEEVATHALGQQLGTRQKRLMHPIKLRKFKKAQEKSDQDKTYLAEAANRIEGTKRAFIQNEALSKEFFEDYDSEFHDLAVIEAKLDGVDIKVGQSADQIKAPK